MYCLICDKIRKFAFTLAEVVIVLGIIGIVAEFTIPVLYQDFVDKEMVVKLKKNYSILTNAYDMIKIEEGNAQDWSFSGANQTESSRLLFEYFSKYLKTIAVCSEASSSSNIPCWARLVIAKQGVGVGFHQNYYARLIDGTGVKFYTRGTCESSGWCGDIAVDLNGNQPPNRLGYDIFFFDIMKTGVVPKGGRSTIGFANDCLATTAPGSLGSSCAAWVIENENRDYLKCTDLAWDDKKKCD